MFDNIGGKIKKLAKIVTIVGIAASIVVGVCLYAAIPTKIVEIISLIVIVVGSVVSWIASFAVYAYGQLVENSDKAVRLLERQEKVVAPTDAKIGEPAKQYVKEPEMGATEEIPSPPVKEVKRAFFERKDPNTRVICPHCNVVQKGDNDHCTCCGATFIYRHMS
ncbi:MAG: hypothetical protein IKM67_05070 [Clostridia bacterium]|nr:hypothetical protein [Clostridia bacterium]